MEISPEGEDSAPESLWRRLRGHRATSLMIDVALMAIVFFAITAFQSRELLEDDRPAPTFMLERLDGGTYTSQDLAGTKSVVVFWAPWCGVCGAESSTISSLREAVGPDVQVISVALGYERRAEVEQFVAEHKVDYPVLLGSEEMVDAWRISAFPTAYILNEDGEVASALVGYTSEFGFRWRLWLA